MIVVESRDFQKFAAAVRGLDKEVRRDLGKAIQEKAAPIARQVRLAALSLPADSESKVEEKRSRLSAKRLAAGQRLGLRRGLAAAVEVRVRNGKNPGVRIVVSRSMFEKQTGKYRSLPRYVEGLRRRQWRHPVYGNRDVWVTQQARPFLLPTVLPHKDEVRTAILNQYEETVKNALRRNGIPVR